MGWSKLISMELDDDEKLDFCAPIPCDRPDFPYGLRITFSEKELKKLGLGLPEIGDMIDLRCFAVVTSVSQNEEKSGQTQRVEMQIERISAEAEADE